MSTWRDALTQLLVAQTWRTQADLVSALAQEGFSVDQGMVSRELRLRGVRKDRGAYQLPVEAERLPMVTGFAVAKGSTLAVVRTPAAFAAACAQIIDDARLPGILGTVAGDDTVLVVLRDDAAAESLAQLLQIEPNLTVTGVTGMAMQSRNST